MTISLQKLKSFSQSPWIIALVLLGIFFITTGYKYGWDDQHLEIPMLKGLIDSTLYQGDYYVESLKKNFTSYFYHILAHLIKVDQVPTTYFFLYIISRYFLFFWVYKLWHLLTKDRLTAFLCVLGFLMMMRIEEFLYRTFSHQEFALPIIFAGIYYFFKERFVIAGILLGFAANFHAVYTLFPIAYINVYLLWQIKKHGFKTFLKINIAYAVAGLPFIIWILFNRLGVNKMAPDPDWLAIYVSACPQNFIFPHFPLMPVQKLLSDIGIFYFAVQEYLTLILLFTVNFILNKTFRDNKKALAFCYAAFGFLIICFVLTYVHPNRLAIDLNLTRNTQFLSFILMGYTMLLFFKRIEEGPVLLSFALTILFAFLKYGYPIASLALVITTILLSIKHILKSKGNWPRILFLILSIGILCICLYGILYHFNHKEMRYPVRINLLIIFILLIAHYFLYPFFKTLRSSVNHRRLFIVIPLAVFLFQYASYHYEKVQEETRGGNFWQIQRNWEDMQHYVKDHTPKDAMILIPYNTEMCGFRIGSERKVVVSYRDIGIIGFDYSAAIEWRKRIRDIEAFKQFPTESPAPAVKMAIMKYGADYIVFTRYVAPTQNNALLEKLYANKEFSLFKVHRPSF